MQEIRFHKIVLITLFLYGCQNINKDKNNNTIVDSISINTEATENSNIDVASEDSINRINLEIKINAEKYVKLKSKIIIERDSLYREYMSSDSSLKTTIINKAREFIFNTITKEIFTYWYGTPWDFNGTSEIPRYESIACGYFVTTILRDAGFNIPRIKWAQLASEALIKKISTDTKIFYGKPIDEVKRYIANRENGLYIVGLDCHVGFIYKNNETIKFVHSNYYQADIGVMSQDFESENPLKDSNYRITGRILNDSDIIKWLCNKKLD